MKMKMRMWTLLAGVVVVSCAGMSGVRAQGTVGDWVNTTFVIDTSNLSPGVADSIWVSFSGTYATPAGGGNQTYGAGTQLSTTETWQSYLLSDLMATLPGTNYASTAVPTFSLNNVTSGGLYFSYGAALSAPPTTSYNATPYGFVEFTVNGQNLAGSTPSTSNIDVSYVAQIGVPITTSLRSNSGSVIAATTINPVTTNPNIVKTMYETSAEVRAAAVLTPGGQVSQIVAPNTATSGYHDWTTALTQLKTQTATTPLTVASYTVPSGDTLGNVNFGYGGVSSGGLTAAFEPQQTYSYQAKFVSDMNPNNEAFLTNAGIPQGTAGVMLTGGGSNAGAQSMIIYVTDTSMNANTGIYGQNAGYVVGSYADGTVLVPGETPTGVTPTVYTSSSGLANDLTGRVVGDVLVGVDFGWATSGTNIATNATNTGTTGQLTDSMFNGLNANVNTLTSGQYFYLISLMGNSAQIGDWMGGGINSNSEYYDVYNYLISQNSYSYGTSLGDRKQGFLSPDITWYTNNPPANPNPPPANFENIGYVQVSLYDAYTAVPEPSTVGLLAVCGAGVFLLRRLAGRHQV